MAEKTILVCDACGNPAAESVTIKLARGNFVKDMCSRHVNDLIAGARKPRRGRPKKMLASEAAASTGARAKKTTARRPRRKTAARRRSSAKKSAAKA
jgi:hypothetical protein